MSCLKWWGKHNGGGSRTRTYEGVASGFTVRPLCRSGHSPNDQLLNIATATFHSRCALLGCDKARVNMQATLQMHKLVK